MALKQIRNKIISTKKTGQVTKAMESVSAVKMRKSQERAFASRPFVHSALRILSRLVATDEASKHALIYPRLEAKRKLVIVVTSDKGLAGSVNSAVLKEVEKIKAEDGNFDVFAIGRKAVDFAKREKINCLHNYTNVSDGVVLEDVYDLVDKIITTFSTDETYGQVVMVYQNFISTFEQSPTVRRILPIDPAEVYYIMRGIKPKLGKFSEETENPDSVVSYKVEPDTESVLNALIPQLVQILLFHALLESKASEHSARMVAMKNATDKSKEVIKTLTIKYNKARQAAITAEVSEITAGVEAMK